MGDQNNGKNILCSWIRTLNSIKMLVSSELIYRVTALSVKRPFYYEIKWQHEFKICVKGKEPLTKMFLSRNKEGWLVLPDTDNYKDTAIFKMRY